MRYYYKVISTNTRDLKTGIAFFIQGPERLSSYIFNVPDGYQRHNRIHNLKLFSKINSSNIFLSSLNADHFGGLVGYLLTSKLVVQKKINKANFFNMTVLGPVGLKNMLQKGYQFIGPMEFIRVIEYDNQVPHLDEQTFGVRDVDLNLKNKFGQLKKVLFYDEKYRFVFRDQHLNVYPITTSN